MLELPQSPHALYRFFDRTDVLLYIGITVNLPARLMQHRGEKPWWLSIARVDVEYFPTRQAALDAEREAIKSECPLFNDTHNDIALVGADSDIAASLADARRAGETDLAFDLLDRLYDEGIAEQAWSHARSLPEEERYSDELIVDAALAAAGEAQERLMRLEGALRTLLSALPDEEVISARRCAEAEIAESFGTDDVEFDVFCWSAYVVARQLTQRGVGV